MITIRARNVQDALFLGLDAIKAKGDYQHSRNGNTIEFIEPVTTTYFKPTERVLFYPERDANPFFHLMESLWMLAGRNDVKYLTDYVKTMEQFSDDGQTFNGAYGYRWIHHFDRNQLAIVIKRLRNDPNDRRCVVGMWDVRHDLDLDTKDQPCNTHIFFKVRRGKLNMTVCNRSNDMIWGAYGANAVHFSVLQEYMAAMIGVEVGVYNQISDSLHVYDNDLYQRVMHIERDLHNPYEYESIVPYPLVKNTDTWLYELSMFMDENWAFNFDNTFFSDVAIPMALAYRLHQARDYDGALETMAMCKAPDWRIACVQWLERRRKNYDEKSQH